MMTLAPLISTYWLAVGSSDAVQAKPDIALSPRAQEGGGGMARRTDRRAVPARIREVSLAMSAASVISLSAQTSTVEGKILPQRQTKSEDWLSIGQSV
jgi:hypothetical protein